MRNNTFFVDLWKLGKTVWNQELWTIQCVFCCWMRWCLSTLGFPKYILPVAIVKGITVCLGYSVTTRYRSKGPRCVRNWRVVWGLTEQPWTLGCINTPCPLVRSHCPCISGHLPQASPCQSEWSWWWQTEFPTTSAAWTSPDWARPVQDWQSAVQSTIAILLDRTELTPIWDWDRLDRWNHWQSGGHQHGKRYKRGVEQQWLWQSSRFSYKKPANPHPYIYQGMLFLVFDSTPSEIASSQEWESLGGAQATLFRVV